MSAQGNVKERTESMKVQYEEKKKDLYQTNDGRFQMVRSQSASGYKFTILDTKKNQKVGAPRSFTGAVGLTRRYLIEEKQSEGHPSTMPQSKIGDGIAPLKIVPGPRPTPHVAEDKPEDSKNSSNPQIVMAHLASIASPEGMFTAYRTAISKTTGLALNHINYWMDKFIAMKWVVELDPERNGQPGSYGFDLSSDEVQNLVRNMPTRIIMKKNIEQKPPTVKDETPSSAGILAGRAMVRIGELESRLEAFMNEMKAEVTTLRQEIKEREKPDLGEFESVLDYLETSQQSVNKFMHDTFGVKIL